MKKRLKFARVLLSIGTLFFLSCSKHPGPDDNANCITLIVPASNSMTSTVSPGQLDTIYSLFRRNGLSTTGLRFFGVGSNEYTPPGYSDPVLQDEVLAYVYFNDLPVFNWNDNFTFYNGIFQPNVWVYQGVVPTTDTAFRQTLTSLRDIYLNSYQKAYIEGGNSYSATRMTHAGPAYRDSCLLAQQGYIDPAVFDSRLSYGISLVKSWKITPLGGGFPTVYIADSTGAAWPVDVFVP